MFELWTNTPFEIFRLAKYVLGPPSSVLFMLAVPALWLIRPGAFRVALLGISIALLAFSWGPTFAVLLVLLLTIGYPLVRGLRQFPAIGCFIVVAAVYLALFHSPIRALPVLADARFSQVYPGLLNDRELIFYTGIAFTTLRYLHLVLYARRGGHSEQVTFPRYLLYLLYAPTYRLGPFVTFDSFDREVDTAQTRRSASNAALGLGEAILGAVIFEAVIKGIDAWFFKKITPDDGSFWYLSFFDHPPRSGWLIVLGVYLMSLRYYLFIKAYSHVAAGMSRMIGIRVPSNMNWPMLSTNVAEFWRRYHVTVSQYVHRHILNPVADATSGGPIWSVLAAFLFIGLWHRPALHTGIWALTQVAGIGVFVLWRTTVSRRAPIRALRAIAPLWLRRAGSIALTLTFVAWTVPILLDLHHGGARLFLHLISADWSGR